MKIEEQVLSIEQMAHLNELGVDTSDASMCWVLVRGYGSDQWEVNINNSIAKAVACINDDGTKRLIPTYTIGDIIEKLPKCCVVSQLPLTYFYNLLCLVAENHKELLEVRND